MAATERRKQLRIPQRLYLTIDDLPGGRNIAFTDDVSAHGISIEAHTPLTPGNTVTVKLALPTGKTLSLVGHVRWSSRKALSRGRLSSYGIGISLQKVPEEFQRFILSLADAKDGKDEPTPTPSTPTPSAVAAKAEEDGDLPDPQPIIAAYEAMAQQNHYEILGLSPDATPVQIKQAYYKLSSTYHPNGPLGECSKELRHSLEGLFHRIAEAYVALSSKEQREQYDHTLSEQRADRSQPTDSKRRGVTPQIQQGLQALEAGQFETAASCFMVAVQSRPDKWKYHTLLAYTLSKLPNRLQEAETHYKKAIGLEPSRIENYIGLGRLYRKSGRPKQALHTFEEALERDAENTRLIKEIHATKTG
jgi:curved DNA-binding protein CbpA